ncbi:glycosyltransferase family 2 protein [Sphingomonas sp. PR090111-T3T-6A]|uniref:glycosyltransferase family 2 protein n=1 Tax=Sphingomonas sp. PR090111-T3T-6A TaxID=685778 RepID=UPI0003791DD1|nr:glycosyltransferase family A protein [Sphingomonas sp. PR090111-T3T-6A]
MSAAEITVIIPAYNVADFILPCLRSVTSQTHRNWRCIVVDDGSTDGTAARVVTLNDPRITLVQQRNAGVSMARNHGLSLAAGRYVMFLDGDDVLNPTALARLADMLDKRPEAVAAFGTFLKILPSGAPYPGQKPLAQHRYPDGDVLETMLRGNFFANGGHVLIRTEVAKALGGFNAGIRLSEDWEFWCRLAARGPFAFIGNEPEVFSLRVRPGSSSGGLSVDWANHQPCLEAIAGNREIRERFDARQWQRLARSMRASGMWEAGRVNFTMRRFGTARKLMWGAFGMEPTAKRGAMLAAAEIQRWTGRALLSRLRYRDSDIEADAPA